MFSKILISQLFIELGKFGRAAKAYIQKTQFSIFFKNWEKLRCQDRAIFKNPKSLCKLGKTFLNPNSESIDNLEKAMS